MSQNPPIVVAELLFQGTKVHMTPVSSANKCTQCTSALISVHTSNLMLRGSRDNTVLGPKLTASMLRDHYVKELHVIKVRGGALL